MSKNSDFYTVEFENKVIVIDGVKFIGNSYFNGIERFRGATNAFFEELDGMQDIVTHSKFFELYDTNKDNWYRPIRVYVPEDRYYSYVSEVATYDVYGTADIPKCFEVDTKNNKIRFSDEFLSVPNMQVIYDYAVTQYILNGLSIGNDANKWFDLTMLYFNVNGVDDYPYGSTEGKTFEELGFIKS